jgi:hypothetical protein
MHMNKAKSCLDFRITSDRRNSRAWRGQCQGFFSLLLVRIVYLRVRKKLKPLTFSFRQAILYYLAEICLDSPDSLVFAANILI